MVLNKNMWLKLVTINILLIISPIYGQFNKKEGDSCELLPGVAGLCSLASKCETAKQNLLASGKTNLPRCGFKGIIEIVCCPNIKSRFSEKSKIACENYSKRMTISLQQFIHGGVNASEGEFPHMAALGYNDRGNISFECGGTLISDRYVLTAAHCIITNSGVPPSVVKLGTINIRGTFDKEFGIEYQIEDIVNHPQYSPPLRYNDISLLRLNKKVEFTDKILPACIHTSVVNDTIKPLATGWGVLNKTLETQNSILQKVSLPLVDSNSCNEAYILQDEQRRLPRGIDGISMLCAGTNNGTTDSCRGDSGGPLQVEIEDSSNWSIIGITSFGIACGGTTVPGVYTKVSNYVEWIEGIVWPDI